MKDFEKEYFNLLDQIDKLYEEKSVLEDQLSITRKALLSLVNKRRTGRTIGLEIKVEEFLSLC
ncbi:hypothetical protein [Vibrio phage JSF13]|jgi:hypothetical protein|uniref:Uncharacterized protein ORF109 n=1 Tax=Vibrio phage ICP1 TaxID=979525 RepID=F1D1D1_9CAUD|nr:hypothetical protein ViPhICP1_gp109 [Vibrio phage ICP1]ADX88155.1 hypothetical protein TUST1-191_00545 [Vibrio phage ICP1_2006_D]ADX88382.1 hypothetical protein TUST1-182_00545 [Vibrio phage ICP1_2006_C]ADX88609.1 hypothetical protein TUST1-159_00545 [Vibrio phage ICP1_2006_B]ADX88835.1 hypothetical protein TUST1-17_00545 [Vibrio phage ICP1_2006_A]ADX89066.1 hypothetical protein TUST1-15_00570 [Vibrio phage ICP1_2005_A]ADX89292.1 hypothetical protein TUST1-2_00550 [Vibrio phage ICP1_2001_A